MRDRLKELICESIQTDECVGHCNHPYCGKCEHLADHLLANGVIVPPCTADDTVYWISSDGHIIKSKLATITTVFLTKEEAEKALAERSEI